MISILYNIIMTLLLKFWSMTNIESMCILFIGTKGLVDNNITCKWLEVYILSNTTSLWQTQMDQHRAVTPIKLVR